MKIYQKIPVQEVHNAVVDNPVVSVCIQTYNHQNYIAECIEGVLMQKTKFPIEILIGEDESPDGTRDICLEYAQKYPEKIRLFLHHRKNVMVINGKATGRFNFLWNITNAKGKYIALCEGDDYWTDPDKLQKQVDALEEYQNCDICFHPTMRLDDVTKTTKIEANYFDNTHVVEVEKVILGEGHFCPTASLLFRRELFQEIPPIFDTAPVGDYFIQVLGALKGGALYLNHCMSVYRTNTGIAWRDSVSQIEKKEIHTTYFNKSIDEFDDFLKGKYHMLFQQLKANSYSYIALVYLRNKQFENFKRNITISINTYPTGTLFTKLLYQFRNFPQLLFNIISLKKKLLD